MPDYMRDPFFIRVRGAGIGKERGDWDEGVRLTGPDLNKGVEVLIATEEGAVVCRVFGDADNTHTLRVSLIPWKNYLGQRKGGEAKLFDGQIYQRPRGQGRMFED